MTLEAFELLIGKVVQTDSSGTILEPLAPATTRPQNFVLQDYFSSCFKVGLLKQTPVRLSS